LVLANGRRCSTAGEVTAGLAESKGSLPPGLWLRSPVGWLLRTGSAPEPYARFKHGQPLPTTTIRLPFDCSSIALRPFDGLRYDRLCAVCCIAV